MVLRKTLRIIFFFTISIPVLKKLNFIFKFGFKCVLPEIFHKTLNVHLFLYYNLSYFSNSSNRKKKTIFYLLGALGLLFPRGEYNKQANINALNQVIGQAYCSLNCTVYEF